MNSNRLTYNKYEYDLERIDDCEYEYAYHYEYECVYEYTNGSKYL